MSEDKMILTPDEALSLLHDEGDYVHSMANPAGGLFIGADMERASVPDHFRKAVQIEIGGPACKSMKHPLAVWSSETNVLFFEADMEKVVAFEASRSSLPASGGK